MLVKNQTQEFDLFDYCDWHSIQQKHRIWVYSAVFREVHTDSFGLPSLTLVPLVIFLQLPWKGTFEDNWQMVFTTWTSSSHLTNIIKALLWLIGSGCHLGQLSYSTR